MHIYINKIDKGRQISIDEFKIKLHQIFLTYLIIGLFIFTIMQLLIFLFRSWN